MALVMDSLRVHLRAWTSVARSSTARRRGAGQRDGAGRLPRDPTTSRLAEVTDESCRDRPGCSNFGHVVGGYGDTTVLRDVSLSVPDSSVVALLGSERGGQDHDATHGVRPAATPRADRCCSTGSDIAQARARIKRAAARPLPHPGGSGDLPVADGARQRQIYVAKRHREGVVRSAQSTRSRCSATDAADRRHAERRRAADARARACVRRRTRGRADRRGFAGTGPARRRHHLRVHRATRRATARRC